MGGQRFIAVERLEAVVRNSLANGTGRFVSWADTGTQRRLFEMATLHDCERPVEFELHARYSAEHRKKVLPLMVRGTARCRKCERCLSMRAWSWEQRAMAEYAIWPVTVFGTVTMSPEEHYLIDARIQGGTRTPDGEGWLRHPLPLRELSPRELFAARVREFGVELQKYLKRIRKMREQPRYLLIAEAHDSAETSLEMRGRPHFHLLIHERRGGTIVLGNPAQALLNGEDGEWIRRKYKTKAGWKEGVFVKDDAVLRKQWEFGFTKFQFAENARAASYLCKYLKKTLDAKIRASQYYGFGGVPPNPKTPNEMRTSEPVGET